LNFQIVIRKNGRTSMKSYSLRSFLKDLSVPAGVVLSGYAFGLATSALGHDSRAGYPIPDFSGIFLSWSCAIPAPLAALVIKAVANHFLAKRNPRNRVSGVAAMLVIAPLLGMTAGLVAQSKENHHHQITREFYAAQKRAYKSSTIQLMADPQIAQREKWYEMPTPENWSPELTARPMAFTHSFKPEHGPVPYALAQNLSENNRGGWLGGLVLERLAKEKSN
jgi:hypothetical protein